MGSITDTFGNCEQCQSLSPVQYVGLSSSGVMAPATESNEGRGVSLDLTFDGLLELLLEHVFMALRMGWLMGCYSDPQALVLASWIGWHSGSMWWRIVQKMLQ